MQDIKLFLAKLLILIAALFPFLGHSEAGAEAFKSVTVTQTPATTATQAKKPAGISGLPANVVLKPGDMVLERGNQVLKVIGDTGEVAWQIPVITGGAKTVTPLGAYPVKNRTRDYTFKSGQKARFWLGLGLYPGSSETFGIHDIFMKRESRPPSSKEEAQFVNANAPANYIQSWTADEFMNAPTLNANDEGSRGCINTPTQWMELLFDAIRDEATFGKKMQILFILSNK